MRARLPLMAPVLAIVGPTASGKSELALELALRLGGEIVNADALQAYRGFDLGTAKPTPEEQARVRHHLLDFLDPDELYSAGEFARRARGAIDDIQGRGKLALVVGGSGLYYRALFQGLSPVPPGDPELRERLRQRLAEEGLPALRAELEVLDPETAARLPAGDRQRILRALEVVVGSSRRLSDWIAARPFGEQRLSGLSIGLTLPRGILYDRIERRVRRMMAAGWVEEVGRLLEQGVSPASPAFQAIGYRQIVRHLVEGCGVESVVEETVRATRRFAKRQLTWFRKEPGIIWIASPVPEQRADQVLTYLQSSGAGSGALNA